MSTYLTSGVHATANECAENATVDWTGNDLGTGSNRVLYACFYWRYASRVLTITADCAGTGMTAVSSVVDFTSSYKMQVFRLINPPTGTQTISATEATWGGGGGTSSIMMAFWVSSDTDQTTPDEAVTTNTGSGTGPTTASVTQASSTGDRALFFMALRSDDASFSDNPTCTNFTRRASLEFAGTGYALAVGDADGSASIAGSALWDDGAVASEWAAIALNVIPAGGITATQIPHDLIFTPLP